MNQRLTKILYCKGLVPSVYYTIMDFSAGVLDVICTRKINIDRGRSRGQYHFFLVHITSCTPAEKAINVYNITSLFFNISTVN